MLNRWTCRFHRDVSGTEMVRVESMVRNNHNSCVRICFFEECSKKYVMVDIAALYNLFIEFIVLFIHPGRSWRMIVHKTMAEMVYCVIVHCSKIPWFMRHDSCCCFVDSGAISNNFCKVFDTLVIFLVNLRQAGHKIHDKTDVQFLRMYA